MNGGKDWAANQREKLRILKAEASVFRDLGGPAHGISPQICADDRRSGKEKASTTKDTKEHGELSLLGVNERSWAKGEELPELFILPRAPDVNGGKDWTANQREKLRERHED